MLDANVAEDEKAHDVRYCPGYCPQHSYFEVLDSENLDQTLHVGAKSGGGTMLASAIIRVTAIALEWNLA